MGSDDGRSTACIRRRASLSLSLPLHVDHQLVFTERYTKQYSWGGHFAAVEQPEVLWDGVVAFVGRSGRLLKEAN